MGIFLTLIIFTLFYPAFAAVDINTASAEALARELSGIGPVKAQRIIEYREKIGGFTSLEQLMEVHGIGPRIIERNRNKITLLSQKTTQILSTPKKIKNKQPIKPLPSSENTVGKNLNSSPKVEKPPRQVHNIFWDILLILILLIICLLIFIKAWIKNARIDKPIPRKHVINTTFVCAGCGKIGYLREIQYQGHFSHHNIDDHLPPGWFCIPNWVGKPCDYCFDCLHKS